MTANAFVKMGIGFQSPAVASRVLAAVLKSSDDAIVLKDASGTILSWNRGAERIYGYSADEVIGRSISVIIPPDRPDELATILRRVAQGETVGPDDTLRVSKHGARVNVSLTVTPIHRRGRAGHRLGGRQPRRHGRAARRSGPPPR